MNEKEKQRLLSEAARAWSDFWIDVALGNEKLDEELESRTLFLWRKHLQAQNKLVMKLNTVYELENGKKAYCFKQGAKEDRYYLFVDDKSDYLIVNKGGRCIMFADKNFSLYKLNNDLGYNVRRVWKKKYEKEEAMKLRAGKVN